MLLVMVKREAALLNRQADGLVELAFPSSGHMLPLDTRLDRVETRIRNLGTGLVGVLEDAHPGQFDTLVRASATYCTAPALLEYVETDLVGSQTAHDVSTDLNELGEELFEQRRDWIDMGSMIGVVAEVGIMKAAWAAVDEGYARRGYAFLTGPNKRPRISATGYLNDVDLMIRLNGRRHRTQVKLHNIGKQKMCEGTARNYRGSIPVISAEEITGLKAKTPILKRLLRLHLQEERTRKEVYQRMFRALGITPPK